MSLHKKLHLGKFGAHLSHHANIYFSHVKAFNFQWTESIFNFSLNLFTLCFTYFSLLSFIFFVHMHVSRIFIVQITNIKVQDR